jgi:hypothetical protein
VAAPPERLRAEKARCGPPDLLVQRPLPERRAHPGEVAAKRRFADAGKALGTRLVPEASAQFMRVSVVDPCLAQRLTERLLVELRISSRAGVSPDVDHGLGPGREQAVEQLLDRTGPVTDGEYPHRPSVGPATVVGDTCGVTPVTIDSEIDAALAAYFDALARHAPADEMLESVVTDDFETGFADGFRWRGPDGLRDFLAARAGFVDESHELRDVFERQTLSSGEIRLRTRLEFFLRQPDSNEELTGSVFHTWLLRPVDEGRLRVAAQIVDGFANLNEPAARLFATPDEGLNR